MGATRMPTTQMAHAAGDRRRGAQIRAEMKIDPKSESRRRFLRRTTRCAQPGRGKYGADLASGVAFRAAHFARCTSTPGRSRALDVRNSTCSIPYGDTVDKPREIARLKKEIDRLAKDIESKQARLADETFRKQGARKNRATHLEATLAERQLELKKLPTASTSWNRRRLVFQPLVT